jgi:FkbM family methyltransferase
MNLRNFLKYVLFKDTTFKGEFRAMQKLVGPDCPRFIVDVGANDGFYASNSYPYVARGWRGVLIEPHPATFQKLQRLHARRPHVTCLNIGCADSTGQRPLYFGINNPGGSLATMCLDDNFKRVRSEEYTMVPVETLGSVLTAQGLPRQFGIISVDTEGLDYEVLLGLDLSVWRPRLIVTEDYKPKLEKKAEYLRSNGYRHAAQCVDNAIWVAER